MYRGHPQHTNIDLFHVVKHNQLDSFGKNIYKDMSYRWKRHRRGLDRYVQLHPGLERTWKVYITRSNSSSLFFSPCFVYLTDVLCFRCFGFKSTTRCLRQDQPSQQQSVMPSQSESRKQLQSANYEVTFRWQGYAGSW